METAANNLTCLLIQRILVPLVLLLCALFRPVGISYVYLLMFAIAPFVPISTPDNFRRSISAYFIIFISLSVILVLCHTLLQILIIIEGFESIIGSPCSFIELLLRHIGFISFKNLGILEIIEWIVPEVIALIASIASFVLIKKQMFREDEEIENDQSLEESDIKEVNFNVLYKIGPLFSLASLFVAATLRPSIPGLIYFLVFLASGTYWATYKNFSRRFARTLQFTMVVLVCHIILIIAYQTPWPQQYIIRDELFSRLFNLEPLILSDCKIDIRVIKYNTLYNVDSYFLPIVILISYHILALTAKHMQTVEPTSPKKESAIQLENFAQEHEENFPKFSLLDQIYYGIKSVGGFIHENSYIFTNVLMMIWSIVFHSWLSFVFLLWANVLWMIPNQRKAMMRSTPLIVFYAELLLIIDYVYAIYITDVGNPKETTLNIHQIGLHKPSEFPIGNFLVKTIFTVIFWITLRQTCQESAGLRKTSLFLDYVTKGRSAKEEQIPGKAKRPSLFFKKTGEVIKSLLVRLWIWLLLIIIFICAITGTVMNAFRICYMALFLFFLLAFQTSSKAWVKLMYGFWIFLIFYAMTILILTYTYQFDNFNEYWTEFLNMSEGLQDDVGLEKYKTKDLFIHLLSPTAIVILTVIQVHYFHKRLVESLKGKSIDEDVSPTTNIQPDDSESPEELTTINRFSTQWFLWKYTQLQISVKGFKEFIWLFLELHLIKAVYITAFLCCVTEVCVLHIFIAIFCVIGVVSSRKIQIFTTRVISVIVSLIILTKMIYQVSYINHLSYNVTCKNKISIEITRNTAIWFGFEKTNEDQTLIHILKKYIIYMLMVTIHAVVILRQDQKKKITATTNRSPNVLFPNITRKDAENNLKGLVKYLFNYGFYKFGLEITLIALVVLISFRQDIIAIPYAIWLCVLIFLERSDCAKLWSVFKWFTAILIILQYIFFVQLPPTFCIEYPWEDTSYNIGLQLWGLLPGDSNFEHVDKLIFDFILLMFITRQKRVFYKEKQIFTSLTDYPGGSNRSVVHDIENLEFTTFDNPTTDFITNVRNWLDVYRNAVLCGLYWITLALLFMAGTYGSDIFSLGYLAGSCIFLWQGTDFYLRPISQILKWWKTLIFYNIAIIIIHDLLNIPRFLFLNTLKNSSCWIVHLFALSYPKEIKSTEDNSLCTAIQYDQMFHWNVICFAFLIFQLRIFKSHYFCHIINDTKADLILASRGAELIEELRKKQFDHNKKHEQQVLLKIKKKMEKIRSNQQKLKMSEPETHFQEDTGSSNEVSNISSCPSTGYHTPNIDGQLNDYDGLFSHNNKNIKAPSSSSVAMTISMEGYEEPKRLSLESNIGLLKEKSSIDSTMLLSPTSALKSSILATPSPNDNNDKQHRRQSSGNTVSWNEPIEKLERSMDSINVSLDENADNSHISLHSSISKRRNNILNPIHIYDDQLNKVCCRRRFSNISYYRDDKLSTRPSYKRPYSWGPISQICHLEPLFSAIPKPTTHHQSIRAGDYYMFQDLDEQFKLDLIEQDKADFLEDEEKKKDDDENKSLEKEKEDSEELSKPPDEVIPDISDTPKVSKKKAPKIIDYECVRKIKELFRKVLTFFSYKMNALSRNYRYVMRVLNYEKKVLKESKSYERGVRTGVAQVWTPFMYLKKHLLNKEIEPEAPFSSEITTSEGIITYGFHDKFTSRKHNIIIELLISIWYAILSNTDILCYFAIFMNQVINASVMSLPLPVMVFLWGTLSLPRPTKTFWVTLIAYTQAIVFIKALFQFKSIWSNYANLPNQPTVATIIGIEMNKMYAVYDLVLLLFLFSHRVVLKSQGLWKSNPADEFYEEQNVMTEDDTASVDNTVPSTSNQMENSFTSTDEKSVMLVAKLNTDVASESAIDIKDSSSKKEPTLNIPGLTKFTCTKYFSSIRSFFYDVVNKPRLPVDVYALMFLCDFINFFVLLFGFAAFGTQSSDSSSEGVHKYLQENRVPIPFLIMLLIQFLLIVIDRALYLRKALVNKIIFHFISVIGIHIWMFFILPVLTELKFHSLLPPVIFYLIKCICFLLSSYQIKCGYPKRILGNFLTRGFSLWNMITFKLYMLMPFLYELRTILDWVCTETTMSLGDWLKMEDIFADIFVIKCTRQFESDFPAPRGGTKPILIKSLMGGVLLIVLIFLIWGPLSIFAIGNAVGQSNVPYQVSASLQIGFYDPLYETSRDRVFSFNDLMMTQLDGAYISDKQAQQFLAKYDPSDIAAITFPLNSPSLWNISPPDKQNMLNDLINKATLICRFKYTIHRVAPNNKANDEISSEVIFVINDTFVGRDIMINMLQGNPTTEPLLIPGIFPKFVKVENTGGIHVISYLMLDAPLYRSLSLKIFEDKGQIWWQIKEDCSDKFYKTTLIHLPHSDCEADLVIYTFNDKKFSSALNFITFGYGIIGLYASLVFVASKVLKSVMTGQHRSIMFVDLPYADRVLQLCLDVYLVREALEFTLEEDLFAKLTFLYRSPATMIKWTQNVWENNDDEGRTEVRRRQSDKSRTITIRQD